ncbi:MAG: hypothetical protein QW320_06690 [Ignisphaera sp.]
MMYVSFMDGSSEYVCDGRSINLSSGVVKCVSYVESFTSSISTRDVLVARIMANDNSWLISRLKTGSVIYAYLPVYSSGSTQAMRVFKGVATSITSYQGYIEVEAVDALCYYMQKPVVINYSQPVALGQLIDDVLSQMGLGLTRFPRSFESLITVRGEYFGQAKEVFQFLVERFGVKYYVGLFNQGSSEAVIGFASRMIGHAGNAISYDLVKLTVFPDDTIDYSSADAMRRSAGSSMMAKRNNLVRVVSRSERVSSDRLVAVKPNDPSYASVCCDGDTNSGLCLATGLEPCVVWKVFRLELDKGLNVYLLDPEGNYRLMMLVERKLIVNPDGSIAIGTTGDYVVDYDYWRRTGFLRVFIRDELTQYGGVDVDATGYLDVYLMPPDAFGYVELSDVIGAQELYSALRNRLLGQDIRSGVLLNISAPIGLPELDCFIFSSEPSGGLDLLMNHTNAFTLSYGGIASGLNGLYTGVAVSSQSGSYTGVLHELRYDGGVFNARVEPLSHAGVEEKLHSLANGRLTFSFK